MEDKTCKDCEYFRQHYIYTAKKFLTANCGHCVNPALKNRRPQTKACPNFEPASTREVPPPEKPASPMQIIINCSSCTLSEDTL